MREVMNKLKTLKDDEQMTNFLEQNHQCLYVYLLKQRGKRDQLTNYMNKCKKYENDVKDYGKYVHGYWMPWLEEQRELGNIK